MSHHRPFDVESLENRRLLAAQAPYHGTLFAVGPDPVTIQAEDFDLGGEGVAYHDTSTNNTGGQYRTDESVDIMSHAAGQHRIGGPHSGEWIEYTIDVAQAGDHDMEFRVSQTHAGSTFHAEVDGVDVTGTLTAPVTGSFNAFTSVSKTVPLPAGQHVLRFAIDGEAANGYGAGLDWIKVTPAIAEPPSPPPPGQTPYGGAPFSIGAMPVTIQAEDYDLGGEGVAYHDTSARNTGGHYRPDESVDIMSHASSEYRIGGPYAGEWLEYTIDVTQPGDFELTFRVSQEQAGSTFHAEIDGVNVTGSLAVPSTGSFNAFTSVTTTLPLSAGLHVLRFASDDAAGNGYGAGLDWISVSPADVEPPPPPPPVQQPYHGVPFPVGSTSITIQAEDYDRGGEGVAYHDTSARNTGGHYRPDESVDIMSHASSEYRIGGPYGGEWLEYSIDVAESSEYELEFRVSQTHAGSTFHAEVDGADVTGTLTAPVTGSFNAFTNVSKTVPLSAGQHVLRFAIDGEAANGYGAGLDWIKVTPAIAEPPQSLIVSTNTLTVNEASQGSFSVTLSNAPTSEVTVTIAKAEGGDPDLRSDEATLTFTPTNWNVAQHVVITGAADPDTVDGSATFTIASDGLSSKSVVATENDDDATRQPGTYYVNLNGDDDNAGTSPDVAWQSIAKVNATIFIPGDRLLFRGQQSFSGSIYFDAADSGTDADGNLIAPIVLDSYGGGNATISAGGEFGFFGFRNGGITLKNLNFRGTGLSSNTNDGIAFFNNAVGDVKQSDITIDGVTVSGFGKNGLGLGGFNASSGYRNVELTNSRFFENRDGVTLYGPRFDPAAPTYVNEGVRVANVLAYDNHGTPGVTNPTGNGIVLGSVRDGLVERSVAHHNGANNTSRTGPVGIWAYNADRITIQHNESYANLRGTGADGGGFDLDQNTSNSVMQYNYAHDNDGAGYLLYTGQANDLHDNNTVRYNVSERDGRSSGYGGVVIGGRVTDLDVYNNTIYFPSGAFGTNGAAVYITSIGDRVHVRNNILFATGGARLISTPDVVNELRFQRNAYWTGGGATAIRWGDVVYSSVSGWMSDETEQERVDLDDNGSLDMAALNVNPRLRNAGAGGTIGDANELNQLSAYQLLSDSPLRDVGLDLNTRYGIDPGNIDFFGTTIRQGSGYEIGSAEID